MGAVLAVTALTAAGLLGAIPAGASAPPATPTNLRAAPISTSRIDVAWDASAGASSYKLVVSADGSAGPYSYLIRTRDTSFSHTGLSEGATLHYRVRAYGTDGMSALSAPTSATTLSRPDPPTDLVASASGKTSVALTWSAPVPGPDRYYVYRAAAAGAPHDLIGVTRATTFDDTGLAQGVTYRYIVRSYTAAGKSDPSREATVHLPAPPLAPADLTAAPVDRSRIRLSWRTDPAADRYEVARSPNPGGPFTPVATVQSSDFIDSGLAEGSTHHYTVVARNAGGRSPASGPVSATTYARPGVPTGLTGQFVPRRDADLQWNPVAGATAYDVFRATDPAGPFDLVARTPATAYIDRAPVIGRFTYHVRAVSPGGRSAPSAAVTVLVDRPPDVVDRTFRIQANMPVSVGATAGLLAGVADRDGPEPLTLACADATVPAGGVVACEGDGRFRFHPPAGRFGTDAAAFDFTVCDALGACTTRTARFTLDGPVIWFVDSAAAPGGRGRMGDPFTTLADAAAAAGSATNQAIFIDDSATHGAPVTVRGGGMLVGAGAVALGGFDDLFGINPADDPGGVDTADRPALGRTAPVVRATVNLAGPGAAVRGVQIAPDLGTAGLTGFGVTDVKVGGAAADVSVETMNAPAVDLSAVSGTVRLGRVGSSGSGAGIRLLDFVGPRFEARGGDIESTTGSGIRLIGSRGVVLRDMSVSGNREHGIHATDAGSLTLIDMTATDNGTGPAHSGLRVDGNSGSVRLDGGSFARSTGHNAAIAVSGPAAVDVTGATFGPRGGAGGGNGLLVQSLDGGVVDLGVTGTTFSNNFSDGLQAVAQGSGRIAAQVRTSSMAGNGNAGVNLAAAGAGASTFVVRGNAITGSGGNAINVNMGAGNGSLTGEVRDNTVGADGVPASGSAAGSGIQVTNAGAGDLVIDVAGNTVREVDLGAGISVSGHDGAGRLDATVTDNDVHLPSTGALDGIAVSAGANPSDTALVCADIQGNSAITSGDVHGNDAYDAAGVYVAQAVGTSRLAVAGYTGSTTDDAAVAEFLRSRNDELQGPGGAASASHVTGFEPGFTSCRRPPPSAGDSLG